MEATTYIDCFPPPGVQQSTVKRALTLRRRLVLAFRGIICDHFTLMWACLCNSHKETLLYPRLQMSHIDCFPPPGVPHALKPVHSWCCPGRLVLAFRGILRNYFTLMWACRCNSHKETLLCPRLRMSYIDCFPPP